MTWIFPTSPSLSSNPARTLQLSVTTVISTYRTVNACFGNHTGNTRFHHLLWSFKKSSSSSALLMSSPLILKQSLHCSCISIPHIMCWQMQCIFRSLRMMGWQLLTFWLPLQSSLPSNSDQHTHHPSLSHTILIPRYCTAWLIFQWLLPSLNLSCHLMTFGQGILCSSNTIQNICSISIADYW